MKTINCVIKPTILFNVALYVIITTTFFNSKLGSMAYRSFEKSMSAKPTKFMKIKRI